MDEKLLKDDILAELGYPTVKVEINASQWCAVIRKTLRWFSAKKGVQASALMPMVSGRVEYDFPVNCNEVIDVFMPQAVGDVSSLFSQGMLDTSLVPASMFSMGGRGDQGLSSSTWVQVLSQLETRRRVFSAEPTWEVFGQKILVSDQTGGNAMSGRYMLIVYKKQEVTLEDIVSHRDVDLVQRYATAVVKNFVGRVRSKYKSYPSAGGSVDTDGPELLEESRAEMELLEAEISDSQFPMGFLIG